MAGPGLIALMDANCQPNQQRNCQPEQWQFDLIVSGDWITKSIVRRAPNAETS